MPIWARRTWRLWRRAWPTSRSTLENVQSFGLPAVVAVNAFPTDTKAELDRLVQICTGIGAEVSVSEVWARGGEGGVDLAKKVGSCFPPRRVTSSSSTT